MFCVGVWYHILHPDRTKPKSKSKAKLNLKPNKSPNQPALNWRFCLKKLMMTIMITLRIFQSFKKATESWVEVKQEDPEVKGENGQVPDHEKDECKEEDLENVNDDELRPIVEDQLHCKVCGQYLKDEQLLEVHMLVWLQKNLDNFQWDSCGKILTSVDGLKKHVQFTCLKD